MPSDQCHVSKEQTQKAKSDGEQLRREQNASSRKAGFKGILGILRESSRSGSGSHRHSEVCTESKEGTAWKGSRQHANCSVNRWKRRQRLSGDVRRLKSHAGSETSSAQCIEVAAVQHACIAGSTHPIAAGVPSLLNTSVAMLYALTTAGSAFKPSINKPTITWRLKKFKQLNDESRHNSAASSLNSNNSISSRDL